MKAIIGFIFMVMLTVVGAFALIVWFSGMAPIQATETAPLPDNPPSPAELVEQGAVLVVQGEVETVHQAEWTTPDGSRPNTPWEISSVPDDHWIQTPVTVELSDASLLTRPDVAGAVGFDEADDELTVVTRGGEIDDDIYEFDDGQDRDFDQGEQVLLVLTVADRDTADPELTATGQGPAWSLLRRYSVESNDIAALDWGDETLEQPLDEVLEEYRQAATGTS